MLDGKLQTNINDSPHAVNEVLFRMIERDVLMSCSDDFTYSV